MSIGLDILVFPYKFTFHMILGSVKRAVYMYAGVSDVIDLLAGTPGLVPPRSLTLEKSGKHI